MAQNTVVDLDDIDTLGDQMLAIAAETSPLHSLPVIPTSRLLNRPITSALAALHLRHQLQEQGNNDAPPAVTRARVVERSDIYTFGADAHAEGSGSNTTVTNPPAIPVAHKSSRRRAPKSHLSKESGQYIAELGSDQNRDFWFYKTRTEFEALSIEKRIKWWHVGRLVLPEMDYGTTAILSCRRCSNAGIPCRVYKKVYQDRGPRRFPPTCAFCLGKGRAECTARLEHATPRTAAPRTNTTDIEKRISQLEQAVTKLQNDVRRN